MAKKMGKMGKMSKPTDMRSKPNPSLRPGTGTIDMAKKVLRGPKKK